jgi:hypothetical protein
MEGKRVRESIVVMAQQMNPHDVNPAGECSWWRYYKTH